MNSANNYVFDFGVNSAGITSVNVSRLGKGKIVMHHAEVKQHPPYGPMNGDLYYDNLKYAEQTDRITSDGKVERYAARFTYHGFRYVEVKSPIPLTMDDIEKIEIHSNVDTIGKFESSNQVINTIDKHCQVAQLANLMSVATDCPNRNERMGWMGDAGLTSDSFTMNFDVRSFMLNYLDLIHETMGDAGEVTDRIPSYRPIYRGTPIDSGRTVGPPAGHHPSPGDPSWSEALLAIMNAMLDQYSLHEVLDNHMADAELHLQYLVGRMDNKTLTTYFAKYGDWCPPPPIKKVSKSYTSSASLLRIIKDAVKFSTILQDKQKIASYTSLFAKVQELFHNSWYNEQSGYYADGGQTSYALALELEVVPQPQVETIQKKFMDRLAVDKNHVGVGIIGMKSMFPVLHDMKQADFVVSMLSQTDYPSYGYMFNNPFENATGTWELLNAPSEGPGMNSRNHHMFSSVSGYIHKYLGGIRPSFGKIHYHPGASNSLSWSKITFEQHELSWRWDENSDLVVDLTVPVDERDSFLVLPSNCKKMIRNGKLVVLETAQSEFPISNGIHSFKLFLGD